MRAPLAFPGPASPGASGVGRSAGPILFLLLVGGCLLRFASPAAAAEIEEARELLQTGRYAQCAAAAAAAIEGGAWSESWPLLKIEAELILGRYSEARATLETALPRFRYSVLLRLLGRQVYLYNDEPDRAKSLILELEALAKLAPWRFTNAAGRVGMGRFFLLRGADARQVLEYFFDRVKKDHPDFAAAYEATGDLALEKRDYELAAESFRRAVQLDPGDPDLLCKLAKALAPSDPAGAKEALEAALQRNPRHIDSLLFAVDKLVDAERYDEADLLLDRIDEVNPVEPRAWAYRAVLAHLTGDFGSEPYWRDTALCCWPSNPEVDYLIGRKLSQHYRFAEGAAHQRVALSLAPDYLPAKIQLSQDLLRLGREEEGWRLAEEVYQSDGYNVVAHNLTALRAKLAGFASLEEDGFRVRMDALEAKLYGRRVLDLLREAREALCAKYEVELEEPITVEIFPEQKDFAIRTFGLPGGAGFLGVCFGSVITANSPASRGERPANWRAVLWHEFCHVVTLHKTGNRMPRWLSEGISVYEEKQRDPAWGQSMNPNYREMILGGRLAPLSRLSAAFLDPPSPLDLQLAYYEASLAVEYLVDHYGLATLKRILTDLGDGIPMDRSLRERVGSLESLDGGFARFVRRRAERLAPKADWRRPPLGADVDLGELAAWNKEHPDNFWGLRRLAQRQMAQKRWEEAKASLRRLLELYPGDTGADSAYRLLAAVHRRLNETREERAVLEELAARDAAAADANLRLMELCEELGDWPGAMRSAERMLAINPLLPAPHRTLARAAEKLGQPREAIPACRALLEMDPVDPAETHYRLARLLQQVGDLPEAKRQTLQALEEAPRFREAHHTLLEIIRLQQSEKENDSPPRPAAKPSP